ncbi:basic form of pathogenesis-related protein 1-like [Cornus florida]|uniref:basic form of pathogenesis-related protein 1-like n=1 Tax=Cornus florida TaxID=4283 RepID=UPI0028A0DEE9|nr:basic form of pathogenesis-related protein 1-like [Cornus florida]
MRLTKISLATFYFMALVLTMAQVSLAQNTHHYFLAAHNSVRARVGVSPLAWNKTVAAYARKYATTRLGDCKLEHSSGPYGENIAEGSGDFTAVEAVKLWVGEKSNYDYNSNSCVGGECLHYTQVVWRNSVHLGCARVKCHNGWWFVTCNYDPPGNYVGERPY